MKSKLAAVLFAGVMGSAPAFAAPINNADIIKLLDASMPEAVIIQAIANGTPKFDTSANALIKLKDKGASPAVLNAILNAGSQPKAIAQGSGGTNKAQAAAAASGYNPEEVTLVVDGVQSTMQYIIPEHRTAARALGFGGVATYASLNGSTAQKRLANASPEFIVSVPKNAQAANYLTLANLAVRNNQTREVMTGGGYLSYSSGINKSRVVKIQSEAMPDQSRARDGFVLYKISPEKPLPRGEYALVLYTGEMRTAGYFSQAANSYFDFAIE